MFDGNTQHNNPHEVTFKLCTGIGFRGKCMLYVGRFLFSAGIPSHSYVQQQESRWHVKT